MSDSALYLCPFCGAFINEEASICPNCNKPLEEEVDEEFDKGLNDLIDEDLDTLGIACPRCGGSLEKGARECSNCDMKIEENDNISPEGEKEAVTLFLCSGCGAFISSDSNECPNCGIPLDEEDGEDTDGMEYDSDLLNLLIENDVQEEDELILELDNIDDPDDLISVIDKIPDIEDVDLFDEDPDIVLDIRPGLAGDEHEGDHADDADILHINISEEIEKTRIVESISERVSRDISIEGDGGDEIMLCGECGAFVSPSSKECNVCGNDIRSGGYLGIEKDDEIVAIEDDGKNTETALRSILGILDDVILDPDPMAEHIDDIGICQKCGAFIPQDEQKCPVCQTEKQDLPDIIYTELPTDGHDEMSICGECGAFIRADSDSCNVCGADVDVNLLQSIQADDVLEMGKDADDPMDILKKALGVLELRDTSPEERIGGELELCPDCGAFVSANAAACSVCDSDLSRGQSLDDGIVMDLEDDSVILSDSVCPNCGSKFGVGAGDCEVCGFTFLDNEVDIEEEMSYDDRVDISDIIELGIPDLTRESAIDHLNEMEDDMDDLILEKKEPESPGQKKSPELSNEEKLARIEKAYEEGQLTKANYIINKAKFYGLVQEMNEIEDDLDELLIDIDETMAESIVVPSEEDELEGLDLVDLHIDKDEIKVDGYLDDDDIHQDRDVEYDTLSLSEEDIKEGVHHGDYEEIIEYDDSEVDGEIESEKVETDDDTEYEDVEVYVNSDGDEIEYEEVEIDDGIEYEEVEVDDDIEYEEVEVYEDETEEDPTTTIPTSQIDIDAGEDMLDDTHDDVHVPFRSHAMVETTGGPQYLGHSGWEYGVIASLLTSIFYVALASYIPVNPISLAIIFGIILIFAIIMLVTSRSIFMKGDLYRGSVFMIGGLIISFILLHWFAGMMIEDPLVDKMLLSTGIIMIGIGIIWIRSKVRYIHLWLSGTIFLFLFAIGELYYFEQWAYSPIQPPGAIIAGIGIFLIVASAILLAYERNLHTSIETEIVRGDLDYLNKDYKKALRSYDRALEKSNDTTVSKVSDPREYDVPWYSKGATLILMGKLKEGIECLDMALSINPNNEVAWVSKGNAYSKLGNMDSALESYNNALIANPRYIIAWNNRGNAFARKENYIEALKNYNRAIKLDPNYKDAWINKGYVLMKMGKQDEALKCVSMIGKKKSDQQGVSAGASAKASA